MPRKPKPKTKVRRVVAVVWKDATFHDGQDDEKLTPVMAITYGEPLEVTKEHITLAGEVFEDGDSRQKTSIPMGMVMAIIKGTVDDPFTLTKDK